MGKIKNKIFNKFPVLWKLIYKFRGLGIKTDENTIIFSCFNGMHYNDSPQYIYEYLLEHKEYSNYKFVWVFRNVNKYKRLAKNKNTIIVHKKSKKYFKYLHEAKYWVFNFKVEDYIKPKKDQVLLQCWHGTPLKKMGCDLERFTNELNTLESVKMKYRLEAEKISYFVSPSKYASEKFSSAWDLKSLNKENILLEVGYPRNDILQKYTEEDIKRIKKRLFGTYFLEYERKHGNKKIILYAPTWRADEYQKGVGYTQECMIDFKSLREKLGDEYLILFRAHSNIATKFNFDEFEGFVYNASNVTNINDLYIISDMLITDYSSAMFDYANLKRPMIFYMYDLEHYRDDGNGFYIDIDNELPGKIVKTNEELEDEIIRLSKDFKFDEKYKKFNEKYNYLDDGKATERVVKTVFKK